ncbi:hypothetical protein niasHT_014701 [Heterodera trifolii]|uniref:Uncharacterized protein n=1 Tax=Heterodera trifolii TaxID=157864 RepID=A0ABD2KXD6_9BILA
MSEIGSRNSDVQIFFGNRNSDPKNVGNRNSVPSLVWMPKNKAIVEKQAGAQTHKIDWLGRFAASHYFLSFSTNRRDLTHHNFITGTQFSGIPITGTKFSCIPITGTQPTNISITGTQFSGISITGTQFSGIPITGTKFSCIPIIGTQPTSIPSTGTKFSCIPIAGT